MRERLMVVAGSSNVPLATEICHHLGIPLTPVAIRRFSNENTFVQILESVREADVFVIQSLYPAPNEMLVELMLLCDALRSASARRITAVIPHYSYARSDKKDQPRISIAARLVANVLAASGADRFLTMTLHSEQVHGFFSRPTDHLQGAPVVCDYLARTDLSNAVALLDMGQDKRAAGYAERLNIPVAVMSKRRISDTEVEITNLIGDVRDRDVIFLDDEISSATSLMASVEAVAKLGVRSVRAACTHGLFCGQACALIEASPLVEVVSTNTVDLPPERRIPKIKVLSVARLFAEAIKCIHDGESVGALLRRQDL
ncbi:MAG: ribose-phosphate diphosphokinase [Armatimonadetes bacterium]|nr:ribose-phosphate diphosphokinase [Armatimonadota bacterium]